MAMQMKDILNRTPESRREGASYVRVRSVKLERTPYKTLKYVAQTYSTHDLNGHPKKGPPTVYKTTVETNGKQVVVDCECEDHKFTWEVALNLKKAARIKHSNGEPPIDRNPRNRPGACKHVFALGSELMRKGKVA